MKLYLMRHAHAEDLGVVGSTDAQRPLTDKGRKAAKAVARALLRAETQIDWIFSSPLERALQTAQVVAEELSTKRDVVVAPALYEQTLSEFWRVLEEHSVAPGAGVLAVGHMPRMADWLGELIAGRDRRIPFKKGQIACLDVPGGAASHANASLLWFAPPKLLG